MVQRPIGYLAYYQIGFRFVGPYRIYAPAFYIGQGLPTYTLRGRYEPLTHFAQSSKMGTMTRGFDAKLANRPFLVLTFGHSGAQPWAPEYPKVKRKNGRLASMASNPWISRSYFGNAKLKWVKPTFKPTNRAVLVNVRLTCPVNTWTLCQLKVVVTASSGCSRLAVHSRRRPRRPPRRDPLPTFSHSVTQGSSKTRASETVQCKVGRVAR